MKLAFTSEGRNHIKEHGAHFLYPGEKLFLKLFTISGSGRGRQQKWLQGRKSNGGTENPGKG